MLPEEFFKCKGKENVRNKLFNFYYDSCLLAIAILALPWLVYQMVVRKKYRNSLAQRLGWKFPKIDKGDRRLIWMHAVSMGETRALIALAKQMKQETPDALLVISSVTETGHAEAKRSIPCADYHLFLPLDFHAVVSPLMKKVKPDLVILSETDYWYNFIKCAKREGAQLAVVNGKMSERSLNRYCRFPALSKRMFSPFDFFCLQNELYKERLMKVGAPSQKCVVTGNLKLDSQQQAPNDEALARLRSLLGIAPGNLVITVGSTHDPEEKWLLQGCLKKQIGKAKMIFVPRHPERFDSVAAFLESEGIAYARYSQLADNPEKASSADVILIDAMGLLTQCYRLSDIAIVCGSYVSHVGGHNILEPSAYGVPVLFGPHMHTQTEFVALMESYQAGKQVTLEQLEAEVDHLLQDSTARKAIGDRGLQLIQDSRGATKRTLEALRLS
jgi:3-deoxy-D-manno-octulosonic-acid transferase